MKNIPDKIWLVTGLSNTDEEVKDFKELSEVTWSEEKIFDRDIPFERAINKNNLWHDVADGDWPRELKGDAENMPFIVKTKGGKQYLAYYASWFDEEYRAISHDFFDDCDCLLDVEYWMEIPELPK